MTIIDRPQMIDDHPIAPTRYEPHLASPLSPGELRRHHATLADMLRQVAHDEEQQRRTHPGDALRTGAHLSRSHPDRPNHPTTNADTKENR